MLSDLILELIGLVSCKSKSGYYFKCDFTNGEKGMEFSVIAFYKPRSPDGYAKIINIEYLSMSEDNLKMAIIDLESY